MPSYLALDLGASSGRAVLGTLAAGRMEVRELHRFATPLVTDAAGHLVWDLGALEAECREGLRRALADAPDLRSVSVDAWGVDYVPLAEDGAPLRPPFAYRDRRHDGQMEASFARMPRRAQYGHAGIQFLPFNTVYQVLADPPGERARTATRLFVADWLNHRLGGEAVAEETMASTSGALDVRTRHWSDPLLAGVGLETPAEAHGWPRLVPPGTVTGQTPEGVAVVATCSHDTAAAVAAVPADPGTRWAFLSLGTWGLIGVERAEPVLTDAACDASFTNEAGLDGTVRFLKNTSGLFLLEEAVRGWTSEGRFGGYDALLADAAASTFDATVDLDHPTLATPGPVAPRLAALLNAGPDRVPDPVRVEGLLPGDVARCLLRSLAAALARHFGTLAALTGTRPDVLHVVGGGARNALLCGWIAEACGVPLVAGPVEATALGNLLVQARTLGDLSPGTTVRTVARASSALAAFDPASTP